MKRTPSRASSPHNAFQVWLSQLRIPNICWEHTRLMGYLTYAASCACPGDGQLTPKLQEGCENSRSWTIASHRPSLDPPPSGNLPVVGERLVPQACGVNMDKQGMYSIAPAAPGKLHDIDFFLGCKSTFGVIHHKSCSVCWQANCILEACEHPMIGFVHVWQGLLCTMSTSTCRRGAKLNTFLSHVGALSAARGFIENLTLACKHQVVLEDEARVCV